MKGQAWSRIEKLLSSQSPAGNMVLVQVIASGNFQGEQGQCLSLDVNEKICQEMYISIAAHT